METVKDWLATGFVMLMILILCGWMDEPPKDKVCVAEIKDSGGNINYISGKVADVSIN